ncbi:MAG: phage/plasmid primase, P4 family [Xenococcaceae cyanobacterium]
MTTTTAVFDIRTYLDRLNIIKETSTEYHCSCPVCGSGGFKINKKNGKYYPFKCNCDLKAIREAIRPWSEVKKQSEERKSKDQPRTKKGIQKPAKLARLSEIPQNKTQIPPSNIPDWLQKQGVPATATETKYWYSSRAWVSRFDWKDESKPKGRDKTFRQGHILPSGKIKWSKGKQRWKAYKLEEAIAYCTDKWVIGVEGEKCVEALRGIGLAAITWQGSNWNQTDMAADLTELKKAGAVGLVYLPDNDAAGMNKAQAVELAAMKVGLSVVIVEPRLIDEKIPNKGDIYDLIKAKHNSMNEHEFIQHLESAIHQAIEAKEQQNLTSSDADTDDEATGKRNILKWSQSDIGCWLAERYRASLAWNTEEKEWYRYSTKTEGIWGREPEEFVGQLVKSELEVIASRIAATQGEKKRPTYTYSFIKGIISMLKLDLAVKEWDEAEGLLPLLNGVLDLSTRKLIPHSPQHRLTWCLPYSYTILATCDPIKDWLLQMCGGDEQLVQLMRAYLLGVVTSRVDWQKYLELIGPGGTGKSTFIRLAIALVGQENVHTTTLKKLEKSRFETSCLEGKRLVVIADSERYTGDVSTLKAITGCDTVPYEKKFKQSKGDFLPKTMVIVAANEVIQSGDYTSGLARRRVSIPMKTRIASVNQRNLISCGRGEIRGEFAEFIPGLLNWVLDMDEGEANEIMKQYIERVPSLAEMKAQTLVETNPIADWLDYNIVYSEGCRTNIGVAQRDKDPGSDNWYLNTEKWLYPNYTEYCHNTGSRPIGLRRFVNLLSDVCLNQLGRQVEKGRDHALRASEADRYGSYFLGLKIRGKGDEDAPLFVTGLFNTTGNTESVMDTVMDNVTDGVTVESTGGDGCYGCDDKTYSLLNVESKLAQVEQYTTELERELREKQTLDKEPSQEQAQNTDGDELQENGHTAKKPSPSVTNDENQGLKVGDRVRYVGKKYRESIGDRVMEVVKILVHWTGNQITCKYSKGWTTWLAESSLEKVEV